MFTTFVLLLVAYIAYALLERRRRREEKMSDDRRRRRDDKTGDLSDPEHVVQRTDALSLHPPGHGNRGASLNSLAVAHDKRFGRMGDPSDLERAIALHTEALSLRPPGHEDRSSSLNNLAAALNTRFGRIGDPSDLERTIELHMETLSLRPPGHGDRGVSLNNLAVALRKRFERMGDVSDLGRVIELNTEALTLRPPGHEDRSSSLSNLAIALTTRFERMGNPSDIEPVVELLTEALSLRPPGHRNRGVSLNNLAIALRQRFERMGDMSDLERVIELNTEALNLRPPGHRNRGVSLNNLANALDTRFGRIGDPSDLERTIELHMEMLSLRPPGHGDRGVSLNNLAVALRKRFERMGDMSDLERVIELHTEALGLYRPGHGYRSSSLNNLAIALRKRFERMGNSSDLEGVIELLTEAVSLCPPGHRDRGMSLNSLAIALRKRFEGMGDMSDLERAIELHTEASSLCPPGHGYRCSALGNIANALSMRFERTGNPTDLDRAIELLTEALSLCSPGHRDRSSSLNNLGNAFRTRFERTDNPSDLERVIELYRNASDLRPHGHILHAVSKGALASALWAKENPPKDEVFLQLKEGSKDLFSSLDHSLACAMKWFEYAREVGDQAEVNHAYDSFSDLLRYHLPLWPTVKLQYDALCRRTDVLGFPIDAAAHAINSGGTGVERALECLDSGRSLLLSELGRFHEPLIESGLLDKQMVGEFEAVRSALRNISTVEARDVNPLASPGSEGGADSEDSYDKLLSRKRKLIDQHKILLDQIKKTEGAEQFLARPSFEKLKAAAKEGPVIVVNCSDYGSHVVIVFADKDPSIIKLDKDEDEDEDFRGAAKQLHELMKKWRGDENPELLCGDLEKVTTSLWDLVVKDVVMELKKENVPEGSRIWWCPTSFLTTLPFHAAGNDEESLIDSYVSSYTPTLKALIDARKSSSSSATDGVSRASEPSPKILVVAQTQTLRSRPGRGSFGKQEVLEMRRLKSAFATCLDMKKATTEAVLDNLKTHSWAHFICHGEVSLNPFDSSFLLYDRNLSFHEIIKARLPDAKFAFLAACHTANQTQSVLPDESLHLAGAMFFSGFRSVVGTMWQMESEDGPNMAKKFYEEMLKEDDSTLQPETPRHSRAAHVLWKVTKKMRDDMVRMDRWINFIHMGA